MRRLLRDDLPADTVALAQSLVGAILRRRLPEGTMTGRIVETEAYEVGDVSSHAYRGKTKRNASMFLRRGHAYVYLIYGTSYCLNISSEEEGEGAAILVRALEPLEGIALMRLRRPGITDRDLLRGPGRICTAFGIGPALDGYDICEGDALSIERDDFPVPVIGTSVRIGLTKAAERLHRFYIPANRFVSGPRALGV